MTPKAWIEYILFVATTTIHVPDDLLRDIDRAAGAAGTSRNRFVIAALREALAHSGGDWPEGFFSNRTSADQQLLDEASADLERNVLARRANRGAVAL